MEKEVVTITLRWPKASMGFDITQISGALHSFLRSYQKKCCFDAGSGRRMKIERRKVKK